MQIFTKIHTILLSFIMGQQADSLLASQEDDLLANVTASLTRSPQSRQGRCILEGADDADVIRGFDRLDALVARHVDELPGVLQKASQKAYRETRRYRTLQLSYGVGLTFSFILDILSLMWMDLEGHNLNNFGIQQLTNYYGHLDTASEGSSDTGSYLLPNMIPDAEQFLNCFTQSDLQETLDEFKVDACTVVEARIFELIILTRASCILGQADEYEEVAEFLWKVQELATALELRNNYIQQANEIKRR